VLLAAVKPLSLTIVTLEHDVVHLHRWPIAVCGHETQARTIITDGTEDSQLQEHFRLALVDHISRLSLTVHTHDGITRPNGFETLGSTIKALLIPSVYGTLLENTLDEKRPGAHRCQVHTKANLIGQPQGEAEAEATFEERWGTFGRQ
jgi:hypothetical protein